MVGPPARPPAAEEAPRDKQTSRAGGRRRVAIAQAKLAGRVTGEDRLIWVVTC